jgi:hypothetical protein
MTEQELQASFNAQFASLAHKHASVSYLTIGILALVLVLMGVGGYLGLKFADAQLARAEKMETQYNADRKTWQDKLDVSEAARAAATTQQQVIVKVIHDRDTTTATAILQAQNPNQSLQDVESGVLRAYSGVPGFEAPLPLQGVYIEFSARQAQQVTVAQLDRNRLSADLTDETNVFNLEHGKNLSLISDLAQCKVINVESDKVIASYKKAAVRSKFRKFLGGAEKVAILVGGIYLGHKL